MSDKNAAWIFVGKLQVVFGIFVIGPLVVLAMLHITDHGVSLGTERLLLTISAIGFAVVGAVANALVGRALITQKLHRPFLFTVWVTHITGVVFIGATYLKMISLREVIGPNGETIMVTLLVSVLPWEWLRNLFFIMVIALPELGVVAGQVVVGDLVDTADKIEDLDEKLVQAELRKGELQMEIKRLNETMADAVAEQVDEMRDKMIEKYRKRFE